MKLNKTSCLELVKKYVKGIENVRLKDMRDYFYYSLRRDLHFHFTILLSDEYELRVKISNMKYGDVFLGVLLIHYDDSYLDGRLVKSSCVFHIGIDEMLVYSTDSVKQFDISHCLIPFA